MKRLLLSTLILGIILRAHSQEPLKNLSGESVVTAVVFLGIDCPISQKYIPTLNAIHERYSSQAVSVVGLVPGRIKKSDLVKFKNEYGIQFKIFPDKKYQSVKLLSATTTPEVVVLDKQHNIKYRGAIDNWFYELGGYRQVATQDYLIDAINALLAGHQPEITDSKALGCFIQIPRNFQ